MTTGPDGESVELSLLLAETCFAEIAVSLNNLNQPVFGLSGAAIGVRVMHFHQGLVFGFDVRRLGFRVKTHNIEGFARGVADFSGWPGCASPAKRTKGVFVIQAVKARSDGSIHRRAALAHAPGRPVPGFGFFAEGPVFFGVHTGEIVVALVVFPRMGHAVIEILAIVRLALGRPVLTGR